MQQTTNTSSNFAPQGEGSLVPPPLALTSLPTQLLDYQLVLECLDMMSNKLLSLETNIQSIHELATTHRQ